MRNAEPALMDVTLGRLLRQQRSRFRYFDPALIVAAVALTVVGLFMVYSTTVQSLEAQGLPHVYFLRKQLFFVGLGVVAMLAVTFFDFRLVKVYAPFAYGALAFLLLAVLSPIGSETAGAQRWLQLPGFQLQPSEFGKLVVVVVLASYLSELRQVRLENVWKAAGLAIVPMGLVFLQPDVGTSMVFAAVLLGMLVMAGAKAKHMAIMALVALLAIVFALQIGIVKDYQIARLTGFIDPSSDPLRAGYNKQQAEIAIGAGGLMGRGWLQGTQTNLDFVPEQHTDFIFTAVGEEFGFVGALTLLALYAVLLWRTFRTALATGDRFGTLLVAGIGTMMAFQMFVNVGMTIGIMPITGIPLPFVSYGGSAIMSNFMALGLILNVHIRRFR